MTVKPIIDAGERDCNMLLFTFYHTMFWVKGYHNEIRQKCVSLESLLASLQKEHEVRE